MTVSPESLAELASALIQEIQALDVLLTGKEPHQAQHTARHQEHRFLDPARLLSDGYYLSDGGYSRLTFLEEGDIRLSGVSRAEVARRWNDRPVLEARHAAELAYRILLGAYRGPDA